MSIEPPRYGPWHEWFAWHPVRTDWHGWRWLTYVERRFWRGWHHGQTPTGWDYRPIKGESSMVDIIAQTKRLQSAVKQLLYEVNLYQQQANDQRVRKEALDTIETYGLTKEDME